MSDVYHTGYLANDRERPHRRKGRDCTCEKCARAAEVGAAADAMWRAYGRGDVALVQRRVGPGIFDYIAQRLP